MPLANDVDDKKDADDDEALTAVEETRGAIRSNEFLAATNTSIAKVMKDMVKQFKAVSAALGNEILEDEVGEETDDNAVDVDEIAKTTVQAANKTTVEDGLSTIELIWKNADLTDEQIDIFNMLTKAGNARDGNQLLLFINGGPGTGKTHTLKTAERFMRLDNVSGLSPFLKTATTGAAAAVLGLGTSTVHSGLNINPNTFRKNRNGDGSLRDMTVDARSLVEQRFRSKDVLVIDEASVINTNLLMDVNHRTQEIGDKSQPFGGFSVVLVGDFQQLPPVTGDTLFTGVAKLYKEGGSKQKDTALTVASRKLFEPFTVR